MFDSLDISTSGMVARRVWLDTIQSNLANMHTTRDAAGRPNPYRRQAPVFVPGGTEKGSGVGVAAITEDPGFRLVLDPGHPDAIQEGPNKGHVRMPDIDWNTEMVNAIEAMRSYEANVTAMQVSKQMYAADLRILA